MKKVLAFMMLVPILIACTNGNTTISQQAQDSVAVTERYTGEAAKILDPLVKKYPNFKDNEIVQEEMAKSLEEYFTSQIGKPFPFISDLTVKFEEIDQVNGETTMVWFTTPDMYSYNSKWDLGFRLLVEMTKAEASTLSSDYYNVKGTLKQWDKKGRFTGTGFHVSSTIWLGTFVISDATVTKR